jgi:3-oxoacyl-[acyl-carrier protein] reductase
MYAQKVKHKALITGGSRGIGAAIAQELAQNGLQVVVASRKSPELDNLIASLAGNGHQKIEVDFLNQLERNKFIDSLGDQSFDVVINNAGGNLGITDPLANYESFQKVFDFNVGLAVEINSKLLPKMMENGWGRITHISSISALENQGPPQYCAAKAALNAYIRSVGRYVAASGVVVTGVMPGAVMTAGGYWDDVMQNRPEHGMKFLEERMAIKRFGEVEEIAKLVNFLVSDAASFMTGSVVLADGGQGRVFQ